MNKAVLVGGFVLCVIATGGCGGAGNDNLIKQQIAAMNDYAAALEKDEPAPRLEEIRARMDAAGKKLEALKVPEAEMKKLTARHEKEMVAAAQRLQKALMSRISS